ncbi:type II toxin-antitoxin system RelE/ParE family toxin [Salmonella enterica]|uniref:Type II toxin-antitoxin system RelE/ParE family toxin n=1 Tax=Salmonella enterica TaxID=28901 RepID=A0A3J2D5I8_SALER|nr:type II toxin-antitoxin system RelE/ParE family toxin [Salmonella enterica]ECU4770032.1 type II toxin-antitoxin system RelE/ParE family toxin [Salmonella enterica subsp. enterica]EDQ1017874.1 type II toxin-antitoxin system RelE/ParE family toxin [Salmonella enterica subsp. houtenae serovar 50:z4,z23:-]EDV3253229.1 type II toxin-antitoxin system RelE/ParE family toxin [Salmonella enterica subsp. houtenae]EDW0441530.1 type II toxin-antitoxin system RelE/ParE family toxin [Salmonella enterica s
MIFIETEIFTEDVKNLLDDDEYHRLQFFLVIQPDSGDLIQDAGGLRKVRWGVRGRGKRSGVRIIYFYRVSRSEIRLLLIYKKGIKDDLTAQEKAVLRMLNERW